MLESWRVGELVGGFSGSEVQVGARCRLLQLVQGARCRLVQWVQLLQLLMLVSSSKFQVAGLLTILFIF